MTLQEAKQKVASNHSYVDWYQLRAHCKGFEGDIDPRMLTYSDEAAEIYCASQVAELSKENELLKQVQLVNKKQSDIIDAFTEQVETLKNDLKDAIDLKEGNGPTALKMLSDELYRLREERKELVEALREADATFRILRFEPTMSGTVFASFDRRKFISALCAWQEKIESLLSKFEPNQS